MTCEEATNLLNARIDGEISAEDAVVLDAHLAECAACRQALGEMELQDAALVRAFAAETDKSAGLANRVLEQLVEPEPQPRVLKLPRWLPWTIAASLLIAGAVTVWQMIPAKNSVSYSPYPATPVGQLTLAKGNVFVCPSGDTQWQPINPGQAIAPGARLRTDDAAKCEVQLVGGTKLRLNSDTEACISDASTIKINSGQLWSAIPAVAATPLRVTARNAATISAGSQAGAASTQLDVSCKPGAATVTVASGAADVLLPGETQSPTRVSSGQTLRVPPDPGEMMRCASVPDPSLIRQWQDDLLVLKPGNDAELLGRVAELLERIGVERKDASSAAASRAAAALPGPVEQNVRARGEAWSAPIATYVCGKPGDRASRRTAARLLADLAPTSCVPDLIELLSDEDGDVRRSAATGLRRLTGQDFGQPPELCAEAMNPAIVAVWRKWWSENRLRYRN